MTLDFVLILAKKSSNDIFFNVIETTYCSSTFLYCLYHHELGPLEKLSLKTVETFIKFPRKRKDSCFKLIRSNVQSSIAYLYHIERWKTKQLEKKQSSLKTVKSSKERRKKKIQENLSK